MILLFLVLCSFTEAQQPYPPESPWSVLNLDKDTIELNLDSYSLNDPNYTYAEEGRLGKALLADCNTQVVWYDATFHCARKNVCIAAYYQDYNLKPYDTNLTYVPVRCSQSNTLHHRIQGFKFDSDLTLSSDDCNASMKKYNYWFSYPLDSDMLMWQLRTDITKRAGVFLEQSVH